METCTRSKGWSVTKALGFLRAGETSCCLRNGEDLHRIAQRSSRQRGSLCVSREGEGRKEGGIPPSGAMVQGAKAAPA